MGRTTRVRRGRAARQKENVRQITRTGGPWDWRGVHGRASVSAEDAGSPSQTARTTCAGFDRVGGDGGTIAAQSTQSSQQLWRSASDPDGSPDDAWQIATTMPPIVSADESDAAVSPRPTPATIRMAVRATMTACRRVEVRRSAIGTDDICRPDCQAGRGAAPQFTRIPAIRRDNVACGRLLPFPASLSCVSLRHRRQRRL